MEVEAEDKEEGNPGPKSPWGVGSKKSTLVKAKGDEDEEGEAGGAGGAGDEDLRPQDMEID